MSQAEERVILITGASSGLGRGLAMEAGRRRARVAIMARRGSVLKELRSLIRPMGGECIALETDIREPASVEDAFEKIDSAWGRVDVLFNSAGVVEPLLPLEKVRDDELLTSLHTNVLGVYLTTREALKRMLRQKTGGTVINITSGAARKPYENWSAYCSQKAAVDMFTRCVAMEVAESPVRVAAISPGPFESPMQEAIREASPEAFPSRSKFVQLYEERRLGDPEKIARTIMEIALSDWPELSGMVADLRDEDFKKECLKRGIEITKE